MLVGLCFKIVFLITFSEHQVSHAMLVAHWLLCVKFWLPALNFLVAMDTRKAQFCTLCGNKANTGSLVVLRITLLLLTVMLFLT